MTLPEIPNAPRHIPENPFKYTRLQLAEREQAIKAMKRDYPTVPEMWLEHLWDFEFRTPKEEIDKIINEGLWEKPGKFTQKLNVNTDEKSYINKNV